MQKKSSALHIKISQIILITNSYHPNVNNNTITIKLYYQGKILVFQIFKQSQKNKKLSIKSISLFIYLLVIS